MYGLNQNHCTEATTQPEVSSHTATPEATQLKPSSEMSPDAQQYVNALISLYTSKDTKIQDAVVDANYAPKAVFSDNLVHVIGRASIKVQFHAVAKLLRAAKVEPTSSTIEATTGGNMKVKIMNRQEFCIGSSTVTAFDVETVMEVDSTGQILKHTDKWLDKTSFFGFAKRLVGASSSSVMKLIRY